jgi:hypothetical protein
VVTDTSRTDDIRVRIFPAAAAVLHFILCIFVANSPAEGSWQWFPVFVIDFPASIVPLTLVPSSVPPLVSYGLLGSAWWYLVISAIIWFVKQIGRKRVA